MSSTSRMAGFEPLRTRWALFANINPLDSIF
jgi:hypothetical protein